LASNICAGLGKKTYSVVSFDYSTGAYTSKRPGRKPGSWEFYASEVRTRGIIEVEDCIGDDIINTDVNGCYNFSVCFQDKDGKSKTLFRVYGAKITGFTSALTDGPGVWCPLTHCISFIAERVVKESI